MLNAVGAAVWRRTCQERCDPERGAIELAVVMGGVFLLLGLALMMAVNLLAAQAASSAAQRALQVAQTPGQSAQQAAAQAREFAGRIAGSSGVVTATSLNVSGGPGTVTVDVQVRTVLGGSISRTASGPRLRFVPQAKR